VTHSETAAKRPRLTADRVLAGALALADEIGIDDFTIRGLADILNVKPMTIYHHIPSKEAIIDGMVDLVFSEIGEPDAALEWKAAMRGRCASARVVLARHRWATPYMESRTSPGAATLAHHNAVLGCLRSGMSIEMTAHAYAMLDAFVYGFALQESTLPATAGKEMAQLAAEMFEHFPVDKYRHLAEFTTEHVMQPGYDFADEFDFGLDLILDGLERAAASQ
jgi:AcrR family transcriptional regulator